MSESNVNILLVDDKPEKLLALEVVLADLGATLVRATSGREALRHLLGGEFAVILLDVNMPAMDGFETATLIRQRQSTRDTPIIFVTAFADEMHMVRGYSLGAVDYILAPVVPEVLRTKVRVFVELYRQKRLVEEQAEQQRRRAGQLQKLAGAALAINSARSLAGLLKTVADSARETIGTHQAITLFVPQSASGVSRSEAVGSFSDKFDEWRDRPLQLDRCLETRLANAGGTVRLTQNELLHHPDWEIVRDLDVPPIRGIMAAPLSTAARLSSTPRPRPEGNSAKPGSRSLGLIYVSDKFHGDFTDDDQAILTQLAQMASVAIENTLYAEEREANRLKDEFLATLSHELRTPLNAILGWTQLLRAGPMRDGDLDHGLEVVERNVKAQSRLIEDLLDVSRITTGKLRISIRPMAVAQVIEGAVQSARPAAEAKKIQLQCDLAPDLGEITGDPDRLQQIVWNLLSNAIKFTPAGGGVSTEVCREGDRIRIRVRDTGKGIHPDFLPYVFDRFRQADSSTTRAHSGLGLGLTIVRHIVEMHGGSVQADSPGEGQGATFTVELPQQAAETAGAAKPLNGEHAPPVSQKTFDLAGLHVLAVDDEPDARELIRQVLARKHAEVDVAGSAREALQFLDHRRPDLLVSDIGMPEEDGYWLIRNVRQRHPDHGGTMPAIALTAYVREEDRAKMLAAGFTAHVPKPVEAAELVRVIAHISGRSLPPASGEDRLGARSTVESAP